MKKTRFEGPLPLSQSSLFQYVRTFYDRLGQEAWSHHGLPTHITCHSAIAKSYAALIAAWIQDLKVDASEPVYVWELGAGMGRLGFSVSRHYERMRVQQGLPHMVYVVTDFVASNVDAMQANPAIAVEIAGGRMDAATLDAVNPAPLQLRHGKRTLDPRALKNPIAVIANYVIDSLPVDAFWIRDGVLEEALVSLENESGTAPDWSQRDTLGDVGIDVSYVAASAPRYTEPLIEAVLRSYQGEYSFNLPNAGLRCIDTLQRWSKPDMLLLSADKAYVALEEMAGLSDFHVAHHASISFMANYHAFALAAPLWKGEAWLTPMRDAGVSFLALRCGMGERRCFDAAFQREIVDMSPTDKHALAWQTDLNKLDLAALLALLRLSADDPLVFGRVSSTLAARSKDVTMRTRDDLAHAVARAADVYLHLAFDEKFVRETAGMLKKCDMSDTLDAFIGAMRQRCGPTFDFTHL